MDTSRLRVKPHEKAPRKIDASCGHFSEVWSLLGLRGSPYRSPKVPYKGPSLSALTHMLTSLNVVPFGVAIMRWPLAIEGTQNRDHN